jgi:very-short-patch-repair endonuclease
MASAISQPSPKGRPRVLCKQFAARRFGIITKAEALGLGMSLAQIRYCLEVGDWKVVHREIYAIAPAPLFEQQLMAGVAWAGPASHRSAAALFGLDGSSKEVVEVTTTRDLRSSSITIHKVATLPTSDVCRVGPFVATTPTRTIVDLASVVDEETLEILLDSAFHKRLTDVGRLLRWLERNGARGKRGLTVLRRLIAERDPSQAPPESVAETKFYRLLKRARLPLPRTQAPLGPYEFDFGYEEHDLYIETDGWGPHRGRNAFENDRAKQNYASERGKRVMRITWRMLATDPEGVVESVRKALGIKKLPG